MSDIHPTAIVDPKAQLGVEVRIGAYALVGPEVTLGARSVVHHHATVEGLTSMGEENEVFPYAYVGGKTHDLKFVGGAPGLRIGNRNVFREYSTVHLATEDGAETMMGNDNLVLAYSHIAHDCVIGDGLIMSSHAALGGHVKIGNRVNIGWGAGVHQFCRIGDLAMVGATSKQVQDVPPYMISDGSPAAVRTFNKVGLERAGYSAEKIGLVHAAYKILYREGLNRSQAAARLRELPHADHLLIQSLLTFMAQSERGLA